MGEGGHLGSHRAARSPGGGLVTRGSTAPHGGEEAPPPHTGAFLPPPPQPLDREPRSHGRRVERGPRNKPMRLEWTQEAWTPAHTDPAWWPASGTGSWFQMSSAAEGTSLTGSQSGSAACKHPRSTCSRRPGRGGGDRPRCLSHGHRQKGLSSDQGTVRAVPPNTSQHTDPGVGRQGSTPLASPSPTSAGRWPLIPVTLLPPVTAPFPPEN